MKLYYSRGACSLVVRIVINEIGLECEYESVDLKTKKTEHDNDFLQINPKGAVPALVLDNKEVLTENSVIQQYLVETHKAYHLLPQLTDFNRYRVLEWLNFVSTELHKTAGAMFNPMVPDEVKQDVFKRLLKSKLRFVDMKIQDKAYLVGDEFTLADAYLFVVLQWLSHLNIELSEFENLNRYSTDLKSRPSIQKSLQQEKIG